ASSAHTRRGTLVFGCSSASSAYQATTPTAIIGSGGRWPVMNRSSISKLDAEADSSFTLRTRFGPGRAPTKQTANGLTCSAGQQVSRFLNLTYIPYSSLRRERNLRTRTSALFHGDASSAYLRRLQIKRNRRT